MQEKSAKSHIGLIASFMEYPEGLCKEDWNDWRPIICPSQDLSRQFRPI